MRILGAGVLRNDTIAYISKLDPATQKYLVVEGRRLRAAGLKRADNARALQHQNEAHAEAEKDIAKRAAAKAKAEAELDNIENSKLFRSLADYELAAAKKKVVGDTLKANLKWYRDRGDARAWPKGAKPSAKVDQLRAWLVEILSFVPPQESAVPPPNDGNSDWEDEDELEDDPEVLDGMDLD
ncbi:hypothetical protein EXIGLDRAFT_693774 [Exidia glandulosa HHB12029]|uniref:Uncharacterized protein n=1 Tax=Exidia glandulosa HHB12029 TaxID=1314781 RepID=A0A166MDL9_EXIGL|nr:hypothetical protein EXIGLDRAFT_693774 [Exidia glandulosa HHB12029]